MSIHPDQPPDLEKYLFVKEIGRGSFSTVYLATKFSDKSYVAIKAIQRRKITKKLEFHLRQEISILKKLNEPFSTGNTVSSSNIIKFHEMIKCKTVICLVMEWCALGDLTNLLAEQKRIDRHYSTQLQVLQRKPELSRMKNSTVMDIQPLYWTRESNVKDFIMQLGKKHFITIANALKALRHLGLIHRDIKPSNILFVLEQPNSPLNEKFGPCTSFTSYTLKVADFGFARHMNPFDLADTMCGSPLYMAPEILQNEKYDAKADLWSVGCIMFELLFARGPPFRAPNHISLAKKYEDPDLVSRLFLKLAREGAPETWASLSPECISLLQGLLTVDPLKRISFDAFFAHPWFTSQPPNRSLVKTNQHVSLSGNNQMEKLSSLIKVISIDPLNRNSLGTSKSIDISSATLSLFPSFLKQRQILHRILFGMQIFLVKFQSCQKQITTSHFQVIVHILGAVEEILQISALLTYAEIFDRGRYLFEQFLKLVEKSNIYQQTLSLESIIDEMVYEINATLDDHEWLNWLKLKMLPADKDANKTDNL